MINYKIFRFHFLQNGILLDVNEYTDANPIRRLPGKGPSASAVNVFGTELYPDQLWKLEILI